jgi:hypothetical protein
MGFIYSDFSTGEKIQYFEIRLVSSMESFMDSCPRGNEDPHSYLISSSFYYFSSLQPTLIIKGGCLYLQASPPQRLR